MEFYTQKTTLSQEEQKRLFKEYQKTKDIGVRNVIVEANIPLAVSVAERHCKDSQHDFEDLVQVAIMGLVKAVEKFDPDKEFYFSTIASTVIKNEIEYFNRDNPKIDYVSIDEPVRVAFSGEVKKLKVAQFLIDEDESYIENDTVVNMFFEKVYEWVRTHCDKLDIYIFEDTAGFHGEPQTLKSIAEMFDRKIEYISFRRKRLREIIRYVFKEELKELCQKVKFPYQSF